MLLSRRAFLCLTAAGIAVPCAGTLLAAPFIDRSGLSPGRFVWHPTASERGPVVVVASLAANIVHIYRGGVRIGISTASTGVAGRTTPTGVFTILDRSPPLSAKGATNGERITWGAAAIQATDLSGYPAAPGIVRLPQELAALLHAEMPIGSTLIVARERSLVSEVLHPGAFWPGSAEGRRKRVADSVGTHPIHSIHDSELTYPITSIVVSAADRKAYLLRNALIAAETKLSIRDPGRPLGGHVYSLIGPTSDTSSLRWLAVAVGDKTNEPHIAGASPGEALARIAFNDPERAMEFAQALHPGATLVVTDAPVEPKPERRAATLIALATDAPLRVTSDPTAPRARPPRERSATPSSRRKLDADEKFPFTIYWPYDG